MADGNYYCNEADVYNVFGQESVDSWSDATNTGTKNATRIDWAASMAKALIDGRFREGPYAPPFGVRSDVLDPVELLIQYLSSSITGVILYDTRRVVDSESADMIAQQRKNADTMIAQIFKGQLKLTKVRVGGAAPFNIPLSQSTTTLLVEPTWFNGFKL